MTDWPWRSWTGGWLGVLVGMVMSLGTCTSSIMTPFLVKASKGNFLATGVDPGPGSCGG